MSHVLTVKMSPSLLGRLEKKCVQEGRSKGSIVREAIENLLEKPTEKKSHLPSVEEITDALMKGRTIKVKVDWEKLRRKAMESAPDDMTPEEEVRYHRTRGLL